ncbi:MAG: DUF2461 domain-containing protein [Muribaculaceae bacterium]
MTDNYMTRLFEYLGELRNNNQRDWFNANKDRYTELREPWLADLQRLIDLLADSRPELRGITARDCAYRIYRDIRFKADKTPYKTYFSACIGPQGRKTMQSCIYLHFEPGNAGVYFGIWCPEPDKLRALRRLIDADGDELQQAIEEPQFAALFRFMPFDSLKKAPKGYFPDHPHIHLLCAKDFTFGMTVPDTYFTQGDWVARVALHLQHAMPVERFLNYVYE